MLKVDRLRLHERGRLRRVLDPQVRDLRYTFLVGVSRSVSRSSVGAAVLNRRRTYNNTKDPIPASPRELD